MYQPESAWVKDRALRRQGGAEVGKTRWLTVSSDSKSRQVLRTGVLWKNIARSDRNGGLPLLKVGAWRSRTRSTWEMSGQSNKG